MVCFTSDDARMDLDVFIGLTSQLVRMDEVISRTESARG
jgi:hypothetical protein